MKERGAVAKTVGASLILTGVLANPWLIGGLLAEDGEIGSRPVVLLIWSFDVAAVLLGSFIHGWRVTLPRLRLAETALLMGAVIATVSVIEIGFRVTGMFAPPDNPMRSPRPELYQADPDIGYRLWPSMETTYTYPAGSTEPIPVVSNSDGFRSSRELDEPDEGQLRILVVGDSFVFGEGVHAQDRITEKLESMEANWRVDNMGMSGWGLDLMIRALDRYGRKADPDVVVLAVYTDDFRRLVPYYAGAGFAYPKFELSGTNLASVPYPYPAFWERLRVVQALYQIRWNKNRNRYDLNEALLDRFLDLSSSIDFDPVILFLPGREDTAEDQERRQFLEQWSERNGLPYFDLTETIQGVEEAYIPNNPHWNANGHETAAEALRSFLLSEVVETR